MRSSGCGAVSACLDLRELSAILLDAITDKDPLVREQVCGALCALGEAQPEEALSACEEYLWQHEKLAHPYRTMILRAMETVVSGHISELRKDKARAIILLASSEMTRAKQAASNVLVAVGKRFIGQVMEELLSKFQPGALPHYFVVQTLASLAASNVFGMVPFLTSILSTMLPMLGMAKHDTMRVAFCCVLQHFSESTLEYLANLDQAPDPTVRKDTFATDIFSAYDILFNHWLPSREAKLRLAVVEALGPMSHLLPSEKLEEQLPKLLPGVLALYKKHAETFHVSKSLGQILEAAVTVGSRTLEAQLDSLLAALHAQICVPVESSSPLVVSNQKEVLRCFTVLASQMEVKKPFILSSMRLPLLDTNSKVKRAVVQVISAMAHHGYLEQPGGEAMVEYIVQQCALPPEMEAVSSRPRAHNRAAFESRAVQPHAWPAPAPPLPQPRKLGPDSEDLATDSVRAISISTLYLVSTTVDRMSDVNRPRLCLQVLWPYLLKFLTPVRFTGALTPLCKSLVHLAQKRQEVGADAFLVQYDSNVTLPSPYAITTRLLTVSSNPYLGDGRGAAALRLLNVLHHSIHPSLGQRWATTIPLLLEHLYASPVKAALRAPHHRGPCPQFLRDTLAAASDNTWTCQLSLEMCRQLSCYDAEPQEKTLPRTHLVFVVATGVGSRQPLPRLVGAPAPGPQAQPCSSALLQNFLYKCIGTTLGAASSKDMVRKQLQELLETARHQEETEREGLACCFGICAISHLDDVLAQLENFMRSDVFRKSTGIFNIFKDRSENEVEKLKSTVILCYGHVAAQAPRELVLAKVESDILRNIFQYFSTKGGAVLWAWAWAWAASSSPVCLQDPALKLCLIQSVCMASQAICSSAQASSFHFSRKAELVAQMMVLWPRAESRDWPPQEFIKAEPQDSLRTPIRKKAMLACTYLVYPFVRALVPFHNLGILIGLFSPRCADLWPATRQEAVSCVYALLYLHLGYEGFSRDYRDDAIERLLTLKEGLAHPDPAILFHTCHSIAQVPEIVSVLRSKLQETREEYVLQAARHSVYLLASQHCAAVVSSLLGSPLPFDSHTCILWRALAVEPGLTTQVLGLLLEKMSRDVPFKETRAFLLSSSPGRVATLLPLAGTGQAAPGSMPACPRSSAVDALQAVLLRGGNEEVVQRMELEGGWRLLGTSAGHEEGVARLASAMAKFAGPRLPLVMKELVCTQSSAYEIQRVTSTGFLAELLSSSVADDLLLLEPLLHNLAARQKDPCASVRRLVLRGLANIASGSPDKVRAHGPQLLTAVIGGLDDRDDPHSLVALEAMVGLARLLDLAEPQDLRPLLLHVAIRIRPFFDSEKMELRSASIRLFGHLNKACHGGCADTFLEQVVGGLVPLLLHLRDPQAPVTSACRFALRMSGPNLKCEQLAAALQQHLQDGRGLHFGEFLNCTCKLLVSGAPRAPSTCAGPRPRPAPDPAPAHRVPGAARGGRAPATGGPGAAHDRQSVAAAPCPPAPCPPALQLLLKDPAPLVRMKAAETLGRLVKFA
ncbi:hypothetical protein GH733_008213 [Mirounga leonina]|nr:hypothetical protein GH733_008213 [Mirounga leonina]